MMLDVDVFSAAVIDRVVRVVDGSLIIDVECGGSRVRDTKFSCKGPEPDDLSCG